MMSKEAKIGLLFSLVFIVAIAVILRSVHEDTADAFDSNKIMNVSGEMPSTNDLSSTVKALTQDLNENQQPTLPVANPYTPNTYPQSTQYTQSQPVAQQVAPAQQPVRFSLPLPGSDNSNNMVTTPPTGEIEKAINAMDSREPVMSAEQYAQYQRIRQQIEKSQQSINQTTTTPEQTKAVVHTVADGENLTVIAMKYYGKKEGNRLVNIDKIYQANKNTLSSIDSVRVGQRLTIPAIAEVAMIQNTSGSTTNKNIITTSESSAVYVVKENDSLWRIAAKELGDGTRFQEILDLNSKVLRDADSLNIGMKLRLPKK